MMKTRLKLNSTLLLEIVKVCVLLNLIKDYAAEGLTFKGGFLGGVTPLRMYRFNSLASLAYLGIISRCDAFGPGHKAVVLRAVWRLVSGHRALHWGCRKRPSAPIGVLMRETGCGCSITIAARSL